MTEAAVSRVVTAIIRSPEDKRDYRGLEFTNGLKAMLISDPTTDKSSAALDVHIGSLSDPENISGLAHFCEHMLFLGTEKYPKENEYSQFLSEHAGSSNAFTSGEHTNYYFDVSHEHLEGALDRYICLFYVVGPTCVKVFTADCMYKVMAEQLFLCCTDLCT
ncbi:hypothetical protein XENOCAPTIV_008851 [Xenoophorus captivus]|uniref:Peptidase M16 N-terminal domain-containing protein n=1 Tax=Xenoophorus captivus TaxID=1517983 RepID=A0ABV0RPP4_9TELE